MTDANGTHNNLDGIPGAAGSAASAESAGSQSGMPTSTYGPNPVTGNPNGQTGLNNSIIPNTNSQSVTPDANTPLTHTLPSRVGRVRPLPGQRSVNSTATPSANSRTDSRTNSRTEDKGTRPPKRIRRDRRRTERPNSSRSPRTISPRTTSPRTLSSKAASRKLKIAGSPEPQSHKPQPRPLGTKSTKVQPTSAKAIPLNSGSKASAKSATSKRAAPTATSLARRRNARKKFALSKPLIRLIQLIVGGLGIATIAGTILTMRLNANGSSAARTESVLATEAETTAKKFPITLNQEIAALKAKLEELPNTYPGLRPKTFYIDVDTGNYASAGGQDAIAAASTIKLPILLAFFEEIDAGRMDLNQTMAIAPEQVAEGSGEMQMSPPGTQFTALEVATQMIVGSDNTATNMMIDLMGGAAALNKRFEDYGLEQTQLTNPLPDLTGTNTTSARDLAHTMLLISQGDSLTMRSRDRILNILNRTYNKSLIPFGLEEQGALTYNKTGDIESVLGDVSLVDVSNGKRYVVATLVERPTNDRRAVELIRRISASTYQEAEKAIQPAVSPLGDPTAAPTGTPTETTDGAAADTSSPDGPNGSRSGIVVEPAANPNPPDEAN